MLTPPSLMPGTFFAPIMSDAFDNPQEQLDRDAEHDRMAKEYDDRITLLAKDIVELRAIVDADISTIAPTQVTLAYPSPAERAYVIDGVKMAQIGKIYQRIDSAQALGELTDTVLNRIKVDMRLLELWLDDAHSDSLAQALCGAITTPQPSADQAVSEFREKQARARKLLEAYSLRRHEPEITIAFGRADATPVSASRS
jgi:hypothetical protein